MRDNDPERQDNRERVPIRRRSAPNPLEPFKAYLAARFVDDARLGFCLDDEVRPLGYALSYRPSSAGSAKRSSGALRSVREVKGRDTIEICHPPAEAIQWDRSERRRSPWGSTAYVLLGTLSHSGKVHGVLAERSTRPI